MASIEVMPFTVVLSTLERVSKPSQSTVLSNWENILPGFLRYNRIRSDMIRATFSFPTTQRFNLSSKESGLIRATNSISQMIATFPMSYFGGKGCKPRYLGVGILSLGIGKLNGDLEKSTDARKTIHSRIQIICESPSITDNKQGHCIILSSDQGP